jgi:hypothetical protein
MMTTNTDRVHTKQIGSGSKYTSEEMEVNYINSKCPSEGTPFSLHWQTRT